MENDQGHLMLTCELYTHKHTCACTPTHVRTHIHTQMHGHIRGHVQSENPRWAQAEENHLQIKEPQGTSTPNKTLDSSISSGTGISSCNHVAVHIHSQVHVHTAEFTHVRVHTTFPKLFPVQSLKPLMGSGAGVQSNNPIHSGSPLVESKVEKVEQHILQFWS